MKTAETRRILVVLLGPLFGVLAAGSAAAAPFFTGLGALAEDFFLSTASAVSIEGGVVVGGSNGANGLGEGFIWTRSSGMLSLGPYFATAVSAGGAVMVGGSNYSNAAFRWNAVEGRVDLPKGPQYGRNYALDVSADGSVIVGGTWAAHVSSSAGRWRASNGYAFESVAPPADIGFEPSFTFLVDVSADGSRSVLQADANDFGFNRRTFVLNADGTSTAVGVSSDDATGQGISADGSLVVGQFRDAAGLEAFLWSEPTGLVSLGDLPGGAVSGIARAVSLNATVVGRGTSDASEAFGSEAFIWDPILGLRSLRADLVGRGVDLTGWTLTDATGISFDGQTIVGDGINPAGNTEAWIVTIPEPGPAAAIALGLGILAARRRRRAAR